ncbi:unnamed protein product [Phaedon cochleariae]|uniref:Reverse transcriptase domain-containing protein n=1 Tax=Phaedon cochleariae TaxID=80249 RepID=A0A9N9X397_PHACE|nr:unnamed protein product [Phaedon cochleariae]
MRPIVSAIGSPTYNISKWLVEVFKTLNNPYNNHSVSNSLEFIEKVKGLNLTEGESFDVSSLFPSVPIPTTSKYIGELLEYNNLDPVNIKELVNLRNLCMKFETNAKEKFDYFPRVWIRYVDDIFSIFHTKTDIDNFISPLNNCFPFIKFNQSINQSKIYFIVEDFNLIDKACFTVECENNGQLPFLDVLVIKNGENNLEFDVFRKETNTPRYITDDFNHCFPYKMAILNFLVHILLLFPLRKQRFDVERNGIHELAGVNGYDIKIVDKLIRRHKFELSLRNSTTFQADKNKPRKIPSTQEDLIRFSKN